MKNLVHGCIFELSFLRSTDGSSLGECNYHIVRVFGQYSGETTSLSGRSSHDDRLDPRTQLGERHLAYEIVFRLGSVIYTMAAMDKSFSDHATLGYIDSIVNLQR